MSTWIDDITDAELRAAYRIVGNQSITHIRAMVRALRMHSWHNSADDTARLAAAELIIVKRAGQRAAAAYKAGSSLG
jgi:hypothetical protein